MDTYFYYIRSLNDEKSQIAGFFLRGGESFERFKIFTNHVFIIVENSSNKILDIQIHDRFSKGERKMLKAYFTDLFYERGILFLNFR
jgi:hypothetical protein